MRSGGSGAAAVCSAAAAVSRRMDLQLLLRTLEPVLNEGVWVYVCVPRDAEARLDWASVASSVREREGLSAVLPEEEAARLGLTPLYRAAWITLTVNSDLTAVGLTAAFAAALGAERISCNVVAGALHDHIFVPHEEAARALEALRRLQRNAAAAAAADAAPAAT